MKHKPIKQSGLDIRLMAGHCLINPKTREVHFIQEYSPSSDSYPELITAINLRKGEAYCARPKKFNWLVPLSQSEERAINFAGFVNPLDTAKLREQYQQNNLRYVRHESSQSQPKRTPKRRAPTSSADDRYADQKHEERRFCLLEPPNRFS